MSTTPNFTDGDFDTWERIEGGGPDYPCVNHPTPDATPRTYTRAYGGELGTYRPRLQLRTSWTNLLSYSEALTNAVWTATEITVTDSTRANPGDGRGTMARLLETVTNAEHTHTRAVTVAAAAHTLSVIVSALDRQWVRLTFTDSGATVFAGVYDLTNGRVASTTGTVTASIVPLPVSDTVTDYRLVLTFTPASGSGTYKLQPGSGVSTFSYAGDTAKGLYAWAIELKQASTAGPVVNTTTAAATISAPDVDEEDPFAFLVNEGKPANIGADLGEVDRVFARIPAEQVEVGDITVVKPALSGSFPQLIGSYELFQPDTTQTKYDAYLKKTVASDTGAVSSFRPTGGTGTASFAGSTTAATNHNATTGTWQTNLNALTPISNRGNLVASGSALSAGDLTLTFNDYAAATTSVNSLTGDTGSTNTSSVVLSNGGYTQAITISRTASNGGAPSQSNTLTSNAPGGAFTITARQDPAVDGTQSAIQWRFTPGGGYYFTGGNYQLTVYGQTTAQLSFGASAATIAAEIASSLTNLYTYGDITLSISVTNISGHIYDIYIIAYISPRFSGGNYTLSIAGGTTANIAYNDTTSTIQTKLNAITGVANRGNVVVAGSVTAHQIAITVNFSNPAFTFDTSSLTPAGCVATVTIMDGTIGKVQKISVVAPTAVRQLYVTAGHGIASTTDTIYLKGDSIFYSAIAGNFTLPDAFTIQLMLRPADGYASATSITEIGRRTKQGYQAGSKETPCALVTDYYLPGVTAGITTAADIPRVDSQGENDVLLQAILAGTGAIYLKVGGREQYMGPILMRTLTSVAAEDL